MRLHGLALALAILVLLFGTACSHASGDFTRTLQITGTPDIEITAPTGSITVRTGNVGAVEIRAHIELFSMNAHSTVHSLENKPPIWQSGNTVHIGNGLNAGPFHNVKIDYVVTMPSSARLRTTIGAGNQNINGIHGPLRITAGTGNITLSEYSGEAHITTGAGNLDAHDVTGRFIVSAGTGHLQLETTGSSSADVTTGAGDVELSRIDGELRVKTGTGKIVVSGNPRADWDIESGAGSVALDTDSNSAFNLSAQTSVGALDVAREMTQSSSTREGVGRRIEGRVNGGGSRVRINVGTGSISIH